ncbi:hypothetical protein FSP39_023972 [Pinctada imbricata]|uniref:Uncharacterized protein n=1 Tax=Pinctada imbricata TaxID=66713 RepID=A0AA89C513_PINIB|nr:hypothetical protein FSP39_023972 [Pinctada imbricata]
MYVAARCAPGHSWINPAERVMSILNIGLQNCALSRQKGTEEFEKKLSRCTSQESIRAMKQEIWEEWEASLEPVKRTVENRFRRLALKDKPFQVMDVITDNEMDHLSRHIDLLFPNMDKNKLVKSHTSRIEEYVKWLDLHCRQRHYSFQIRKCDQPECCSPVTTRCSWLPDPVLDDTGNHYKSFEDVYTTNTTEEDRPTLTRRAETITAKKKVPNKGSRTDPIINIVPEDINLRGEASLFTGQNARYTVTCNECEKPRIIYSKSKLTERQKVQLALLMSEYEYTCGSPLTPPDHSLHGKLLTKLNIECKNPVETAYYSSSIDRPDICYYCGASEAPTDMELKKQFKTVFPLCDTCRNKGFKVATLRPYGKHK